MADDSAPVFKKRGPKANLRKRPATPPPADASSQEYSSNDESGQRVRKRRKGGIVATGETIKKPDPAALKVDSFAADKSATIASYNDATKQSNWYDEGKLDAKSLLGSTRNGAKPATEGNGKEGTYQGTSSYSNFIQKNPEADQRKLVGPMKSSTNVRTITITDYAPDVCKDYKQTGFCGFGDSCKFLHAREDYKQGWALDRDWEINTKGKKQDGKIVASANRDTNADDQNEDEKEAALLEKIPFACVICKQPYKNPIVTKCEHYFCEKCALQRYRKNPNCAACGSGTGGVFNGAKNLKKLLEKKKAREERLKLENEGQKEEEEEEGKS